MKSPTGLPSCWAAACATSWHPEGKFRPAIVLQAPREAWPSSGPGPCFAHAYFLDICKHLFMPASGSSLPICIHSVSRLGFLRNSALMRGLFSACSVIVKTASLAVQWRVEGGECWGESRTPPTICWAPSTKQGLRWIGGHTTRGCYFSSQLQVFSIFMGRYCYCYKGADPKLAIIITLFTPDTPQTLH